MSPLEGVARESVGQRTRLRGQILNPISQPKPLAATGGPRMPVEIKDAGQCACSQSLPSMLGEHLSEKRSHGTPDGVILVRVQQLVRLVGLDKPAGLADAVELDRTKD